jgi:hypothetical protein
MRTQSLVPGLALLVTLGFTGCGGAPETPGSDTATDAPSIPQAKSPPDACGWITPSAASEILGELAGAPQVVRSIERPQPDSFGGACRYDLPGSKAVLLQVDLHGGLIQELVGGSMIRGFREAVGAAEPAAEKVEGWDHTGKLLTGYATMSGRVGHLAISVASLTPDMDTTVTAALARRVRDDIPDQPFALPPDRDLEALEAAAGEPIFDEPSGPDPCALISPQEAEAVLGTLLVAPYRSADNSPLADPAGAGCSYYTKGHRVFTVTPRWDSGPMLFRMAAGVSGAAGAVIGGAGGAVADTAEGAWEESASNSVTGQLYFLKGQRMLEVSYLTSSTDLAGALRLAGEAMKKL